jgi:hypothetical protein
MIAAALWWWLQPGGFPWQHARFWTNRCLPLLVLVWGAGSLAALHAENRKRLALWLPAWPAVWGAGAVAGRVVFPISLARLWLAPLVGALLMLAWLAWNWHRLKSRPEGRVLAVFGTWCLIGTLALLSQRPPPPDTRPTLAAFPLEESSAGTLGPLAAAPISLDPGVMIDPSDGSINVHVAPLTLIVNPLLNFLSRSPDGCWTVLARQKDREGPEARLLGARKDGDQSQLLAYEFPRQGGRACASHPVQSEDPFSSTRHAGSIGRSFHTSTRSAISRYGATTG